MACWPAIDIHPDGAPGKRGHALQKKLFDNGLHLKTTGDCAIIAPPLIAEKKDVDIIVDCLAQDAGDGLIRRLGFDTEGERGGKEMGRLAGWTFVLRLAALSRCR